MAAPRVGFLGLGVMGRQMATRLLKEGVDVVVWNRTLAKCDDLVALGATAVPTPAEVVSECSLVHAMLSDPAASESVCFGRDGVLAALEVAPRVSYVEHSTIDEASSARIGEAVGAAGARFLFAPVSGGWRDAAKGELLFICGGDRSLYDDVTASERASLRVMGAKHWFVGDDSKAPARAKLMLQIMMGSYIGALAEMMALTDKAGVDPSQVLDMFNNSAMANPISAAKGKLMIDENYDPNFQVYLQQKDLRLVLQLADDLGMPAPITAAVNAQYVAARQRGHANDDFAAVREVYRKDDPS